MSNSNIFPSSGDPTYLYPPVSAQTYPTFPSAGGGGGPCEPSELIELTDAGMGELVGQSEDRVSSLSYNAATGWTLTWSGAGTNGANATPTSMAYRRVSLASLGFPTDQDLTSYGFDLLIATDNDGLINDSVYGSGPGLAVFTDDRGSGQGLAVTTQNATTLNCSRISSSVAPAATATALVGWYNEFRTFVNESNEYQFNMAQYYYESTFEFDNIETSAAVGQEVFTSSPADTYLYVFAVAAVSPTSTMGAYSQTFRLYYRFNPMLRLPSLAEVTALS